MIENIPRSVILAIKAAAKDVATSVKGGAYEPITTDNLATTLEKFMISMVAQSYPKVKSSWIDKDMDKSWVKSALGGDVIDGVKLQQAFDTIWTGNPDKVDLERVNYSKYIGKPISLIEKERPDIYKAYVGDSGIDATPIGDLGVPETTKTLGDKISTPEKPLPTHHEKKEGEPPAKQELMKPGHVGHIPQEEEFDKGIPSKSII